MFGQIRTSQQKLKSAGYRCPALSGFTLIEILVVISIISILMSILLPSLSRAREMGKRVDCFSNIRQLTFAWHFYATDNGDKVCSPDTLWNDTGLGNYWDAEGPDLPDNDVGNTEQAIADGILWPYTEETLGLYKCKSDQSNFLRSYSISAKMRWGLESISKPSGKMLFTDASSNWKWIHNGFSPIEFCAEGPKWWPWDRWHLQQITARHNGGFNMTFGDFHCENWHWKDPRTVRFVNREISADEASENNRDITRLLEVLR
jgi:prepilin-type N-terminal cleavage/methylation domain-containing protein/prepilin-type processing-associated H-X9-DG protein